MTIRKIKKILVLLLFFILCSASALASNYSMANGIILNGNKLNLDTNPIIKDGRTMVPIRAILEELGMKVTWDSDSRTVIGEKEDNVLKISLEENWIGEGTYNEVPFHSENSPNIIVNNRTLVPVRTVATLLDLEVKWEQSSKNVILKEAQKPKLTLKEAYGELGELYISPEINEKLEFAYLPFGGYATKNDYVLDNYYIFSVNSYYEEISQDGSINKIYSAWDMNVCVDKNTGERKSYEPILGIEGTVPYKVKDYILNHQHHLSNAEAFWWDETHLENLSDETINDLYRDFLKSGGNEYIIRDFAQYLSMNAPIYPNWKEVFESNILSGGGDIKITRYEEGYSNGYIAVYIEGFDSVYVNVNTRTGYYRG